MYLATIMLLGSGELGREFTIAAKRLGCRVIACDRYDDAPAMQLADAREVFPMLDGARARHKPTVEQLAEFSTPLLQYLLPFPGSYLQRIPVFSSAQSEIITSWEAMPGVPISKRRASSRH